MRPAGDVIPRVTALCACRSYMCTDDVVRPVRVAYIIYRGSHVWPSFKGVVRQSEWL